MKKLNEKGLVEVKGGFASESVDPNVSFLCVTNFTSKHKHNLIKWLFHLK